MATRSTAEPRTWSGAHRARTSCMLSSRPATAAGMDWKPNRRKVAATCAVVACRTRRSADLCNALQRGKQPEVPDSSEDRRSAPAKGPSMNREQWLAQRRLRIGGSDVAAILGLSRYARRSPSTKGSAADRAAGRQRRHALGPLSRARGAPGYADETGNEVRVIDQIVRHRSANT